MGTLSPDSVQASTPKRPIILPLLKAGMAMVAIFFAAWYAAGIVALGFIGSFAITAQPQGLQADLMNWIITLGVTVPAILVGREVLKAANVGWPAWIALLTVVPIIVVWNWLMLHG